MKALEAEGAGLEARDRALSTALVYGTLRVLPFVDAARNKHLKRAKMNAWVRCLFRVAAFELAKMSAPDYAIADSYVTLARERKGKEVGRFVNAVLQKMVKERKVLVETCPKRIDVAPWLQAALVTSVGSDHAEQFLAEATEVPPTDMRVRRDAHMDTVKDELAGIGARDIQVLSAECGSVRAHQVGDLRSTESYARGFVRQQEYGAQLIARMVDAQPDETIGDFCAGHGGKSLALVDFMKTGSLTAVDLHPSKLEQFEEEYAALGKPPVELSVRAVDLVKGAGGMTAVFDRILVDAPCSGTGTLRRRPEILLRLTEERAAELQETQVAIAERALSLLKPGGILVFAVCSLDPREGLGVLERLVNSPIAPPWLPPNVALPDDGIVKLGPWTGTDGYQIFCVQNKNTYREFQRYGNLERNGAGACRSKGIGRR